MISKTDEIQSEGEDKWLTSVKKEQYSLHVEDTLVDVATEQANVATRQHS